MSVIDFYGAESGVMPHGETDSKWSLRTAGGLGGAVGIATGGRTGTYAFEMGGGSRTGYDGLYRNFDVAEESDTVIIGGAVRFGSQDINNQCHLFHFTSDALATCHISVIKTTGKQIQVQRGAPGGTVLGTGSDVLVQDVFYYVEAKVVLHDTDGSVVVKLDGNEILNLTGIDTKNGGTKTVFDGAGFGSGQETVNTKMRWDDCYIANGEGATANDFLNGPRIYPIVPNGNGSQSDFVGSDGNSTDNYLLVDERPAASADYVGSSTAADQDLYAMSTVTWQPTSTPMGLKLYAGLFNSDASTRDAKLGVRTNSTTDMDAGHSIGTGVMLHYSRLLVENPVTATAWTQGEIDALEAGVEVA